MDQHTQAVLDYSLAVLRGQAPHSFDHPLPASISSRSIEVPWVAETLRGLGAKRHLDVGFSLSSLDSLGVLLANRRDNGVELQAVDIIEPQRVQTRYPAAWLAEIMSVPVRVGDIRAMSLEAGGHDLISLISTIEHIGFDKPAADQGRSAFDRAESEAEVVTQRAADVNRRVLDNLRGALAAGGHLLLTVPMGKGGPVVLRDSLGFFCVQWEYEAASWAEIVEHPGFELVESHYFALGDDLAWRAVNGPAGLARAEARHLSHSTGCALALLRKKAGA